MLTPKSIVSAVPKKNLVRTLTYLGRLSLQIRTRIKQIMKNKLTYFNRWGFFQPKCNINNVFTFKDRVPSSWRSGIVYKCQCGGCNATYYDKCKSFLKVRLCEHLKNLKTKLMESLLINRDHHFLNKNNQFFPLKHFDN